MYMFVWMSRSLGVSGPTYLTTVMVLFPRTNFISFNLDTVTETRQ